jgi:hypothetical protein
MDGKEEEAVGAGEELLLRNPADVSITDSRA